jgi:hypothetical protein
MNKKLELLLKFLNKLNVNTASLDVDIYDGEISNVDGGMSTDTGSYFNLPQPLSSYIDDIVEPYVEEYFETYESMEGVEYDDFTGQETLTIIFYPKERKIEITSEEVWSDTEANESEIDLNNYPDLKESVNQVFEEFGYDGEIMIDYEGSGDDGYINNTMKINGVEQDLNEEIEEIVYNVLGNFYGGWENNDGSKGMVTITKDMIHIEHIWYVTDYRESHHELEMQL